jgi:hypothetical protein
MINEKISFDALFMRIIATSPRQFYLKQDQIAEILSQLCDYQHRIRSEQIWIKLSLI